MVCKHESANGWYLSLLAYPDPVDRVSGISVISVVVRETTLTISDSTGEPLSCTTDRYHSPL